MSRYLLIPLLIGASTFNVSVVSPFANTNTIHFFSNALSVTGTTRQLRPRRTNPFPKPKFYESNNQSIKTTIRKLAKASSAISRPSIDWIPTRIEFDGVYRSYGAPTFWRTLTSSVPRRKYALQDISLSFGKSSPVEPNLAEEDDGNDDSLCLLLGASSSGKSTIFRSLLEAAIESTNEARNNNFGSTENEGQISIRQLVLPEQTGANPTAIAKPVLLDDRGEVNSSSGKPMTTLTEAWSNCAIELLQALPNNNEGVEDLAMSLATFLADEIFDLDPEALLSDLTPSEKYRFCLGKACIESSLGVDCGNSDDKMLLPGPILLLDEWMDVETSAVVRKVQPSLHKVVEQLNGVVLSITHKPELYARDISSIRRITLSAGKLLSDY